jgi:hypothetical protein
MKRPLFVLLLLSLAPTGCPKAQATGPAPAEPQPPPGEVWIDASQMKEAGILVEPVV